MNDDQGDGLDTPTGGIQTPFLTPTTAAEILGISPHTLKRGRRRGEGPPYRKHGNHVVYFQNDDRRFGPSIDIDALVRSIILKNGSPYLNTRQAAAFLKMGVSTLERKRVEGTGPRYRKHSRVSYHILDLIEWSYAQSRTCTRDLTDIPDHDDHDDSDNGDDGEE